MANDKLHADLKAALRPFGEEAIRPDDADRARRVDQVIDGSGMSRVDRLSGPLPSNLHGVIQDESVEISFPAFTTATNLQALLTQIIAGLSAAQITVTEADNSPSGSPRVIVVPNGSLTIDSANEIATLTFPTYTNEEAQDAVGTILTDSASIDIAYDDGANTISATVILEWLQDAVAAMITGGTHTDLTATYDDTDGFVDLAVTGGGGAGSSALHPGWTTGRYYSPHSYVGGTFTNLTPASNDNYFTPIFIPHALTLVAIGMYVNTANAGATLRMGLFANNADGTPGARIGDYGTVSMAATGFQEITISEAISTPGWYWLAFIKAGTLGGVVRTISDPGSFLGESATPGSTARNDGGWLYTAAAGGTSSFQEDMTGLTLITPNTMPLVWVKT